MKIFAKRKRKAVPARTIASSKERDTFASDPVVEELLTKDPKEWNSKERRMIKRYEDRKEESLNASPIVEDRPEDSIQGGNENAEEEVQNEASSNSEEESDTSVGDSSDDGKEPNAKMFDDTVEVEAKIIKTTPSAAPKEKDDAKTKAATSEKWSDEPTTLHEKEEEGGDGKIDPEHEVYKLLEKLNSKMKRTLSRKLDRQGAMVLDEVHNEAKKIIGGTADEKESKKRDSSALETKSGAEESQSNKKSKKDIDWSKLSAEERLRREEQRRKQKEAVERRAKGEDKTPGYKHPLNSERRRANRRKPKWKNGTPSPGVVKNEHNHSGYHHRKEVV